MKFTLRAEVPESSFYKPTSTTREFECDHLPEVLEEIQIFLKGCGYHFDGILDIVKEDNGTST